MAITTTDGKLSVMEMEEHWTEAIPLGATAPFSQDEQQHLIWGFAEVSWSPPAPVSGQYWNRVSIQVGMGI